MIKLAGIASHTSDIASYASTYSMVEKNLSNPQKSQLTSSGVSVQNTTTSTSSSPTSSNVQNGTSTTSPSINHHNQPKSSSINSPEADQAKPKKIRLPSISSIASSLQQPITHITSDVKPTAHSPPLTYNQRAHSDPELNKLHMAADIFTKEQQQKNASANNVSSPMIQHQQPALYQIPQPQPQPIPQQYQQHHYAPQYHQLPPPPPPPGAAITPAGPAGYPQQFAPQQIPPQSYYIAHSYEQYPHYTTAAPSYPFQHHQIKPKRNYTRRLSKIQQENKLKPQLICQRCGITETPEWRKGPNGARTLCNACGLFHAKILKRDGPEAAANAINSNKIIKKNHFKRRSSVNDAQLISAYHQQQHQVQQQQPQPQLHHQHPIQHLPPPTQLFPGQPPQSQQLNSATPQPQRVISLPPGVQPIMNSQGIPTAFVSHPGSGAPTPVQHVQQQPHRPHHLNQQGIILSPISPPVMQDGHPR